MILQFVLLYALAQMKIQIISQHFPYLGKNVNFKTNRVFIYFHKDGPIRIVGNPQKFWLLSFQIEKSVISSFLQNANKAGLEILLDIHLWPVTVLTAMSYFKAYQ